MDAGKSVELYYVGNEVHWRKETDLKQPTGFHGTLEDKGLEEQMVRSDSDGEVCDGGQGYIVSDPFWLLIGLDWLLDDFVLFVLQFVDAAVFPMQTSHLRYLP